jgi:hypothetical protein
MFDVTTDANGVIHLTVGGRIGTAQMRALLDAFLAAVGAAGKVNVLYTVTDVRLPTAGALAVECGYLPRLFGLLGQLDKVALVADQAWVRTAARVESALLPGLTIAVFEPGNRAAALAHVGAAA